MAARKRWILGAVGLGLTAYLALWPVPVAPVAWSAPEDQGLTGAFAPNRLMAAADLLPLGGHVGPEDAVEGPNGQLFVSTHAGAAAWSGNRRTASPGASSSAPRSAPSASSSSARYAWACDTARGCATRTCASG